MTRKRKIPYLFVYYLVFIMGFSIIKNLAGWNARTFEQLSGSESNFVSSALAFLSEIILSLFVGMVLFMITRTRAFGKLIIWATATVIPVTFVVLIMAHFVFGYVNNKWAMDTSQQLHTEIINRLPPKTFKKMSGSKADFTGYVTAGNDSLGLIVADTNGIAKVYLYVDSVKIGPINFDSCTACNPVLQKILSTIVIPMQSLSSEETLHNLNFINNGQCYVADQNIYIGYCRKPGRQFIIINGVYDEVRHLHCYEIGFQMDVKTPEAHKLELFE
jgi:hypothetical protein